MRDLVTITSLLGEEKKQTKAIESFSISGETKITLSTLPSETYQSTNIKLKLKFS